MKKIELGRTGIYVSQVGIGANKITYENQATHTEYGGKVISTAIENGLNFIDTAYIYGNGVSEEIIGKTIKENNWRQEVVIATKGSHRISGYKMEIDNSPEILNRAVEDSLKRLQTDVIDLFYIHFPDESTPKYEAIGALQRLKEDGKIRSIGVSNFSLTQLMEANQDGYVDVVQDKYNLIDRSAESQYFPYLEEKQISFIPFYPLASGLLSGKYHPKSPISEKNKARPQFQGKEFYKNLEKVEKIKGIANKRNVSVPNIVLAFYLTRSNIDAVIPGARNTKQILGSIETAKVNLTDEDIKLIEEIYPVI